MGKTYREAVVGVFVNIRNEVLVLERADISGAWQLPQGGLDDGESPLEALKREMYEELGTKCFEVIDVLGDSLYYNFPESLTAPIAKKYKGQSLRWFLLKFTADSCPNLENAKDREFIDYKWVEWMEACTLVSSWKRECYLEGFEGLGFK